MSDTEPSEVKDISTDPAGYVRAVHKVHPGLRRWAHLWRDFETGQTQIDMWDLDVRQDWFVWRVNIHPRDILICGDGFIVPAFSAAEAEHTRQTGELPPGMVKANYPTG